jgi:hypothetical protein
VSDTRRGWEGVCDNQAAKTTDRRTHKRFSLFVRALYSNDALFLPRVEGPSLQKCRANVHCPADAGSTQAAAAAFNKQREEQEKAEGEDSFLFAARRLCGNGRKVGVRGFVIAIAQDSIWTRREARIFVSFPLATSSPVHLGAE